MGQKFGRLTVIKRSFPNSKWGHVKWLCLCSCGKAVIVHGDNLRGNHTKSCGCLDRELSSKRCKIIGGKNKLKLGLVSMRQVMNFYKHYTKKRKYSFELTEKQFAEITQKSCYYCGAKPNNISHPKEANGAYIYNGIDRIDNAKGYTMDNVVPCCWICNKRKGNSTLKEFKDWVKQVHNKLFEKKDDSIQTVRKR